MFKKLKWNSKNSTKSVGEFWELKAQRYLETQGAICLETNYRGRFGEIDLIMQENDTIIFVEVKYRQSVDFGGALFAISEKKCQKIVKTANFYLQQMHLNAYNTACRFDVVAIQGTQQSPKFTWLKNAFTGV